MWKNSEGIPQTYFEAASEQLICQMIGKIEMDSEELDSKSD